MRNLLRLFTMALLLVLSLAAQISVPVTVTLDPDYVPGHKEWMACTLIGPNVGDLATCDKSDITNAQAIALIQSWVDRTVKVFLEERAIVWLEKNRPDELPLDHKADLDAEAAAKAAKELKRQRAVQ